MPDGKVALRLLPALPKARTDVVRGLRARGSHTVDLKWRAGKLVSRPISGGDPKVCAVLESERCLS